MVVNSIIGIVVWGEEIEKKFDNNDNVKRIEEIVDDLLQRV